MELTLFGQIALTVIAVVALGVSMPIFMLLSEWMEDLFDSFVAVFIGFMLWLITFVAIALCIPMIWGAGFAGAGG